MFYEPEYKSCTKLIATIASEKFGFDTKPLADLIHWGDIIDGAQYPTPQSAVELAEPATQLALVIEAAPENGLPARIIPELAYRPLSEMVKLPLVAKHLGPLLERHRRSIEILRERIEARDGVIFFDVSDMDLEATTSSFPICCTGICLFRQRQCFRGAREVSLGTNRGIRRLPIRTWLHLRKNLAAAAIRACRPSPSSPAICLVRVSRTRLTATLRGK